MKRIMFLALLGLALTLPLYGAQLEIPVKTVAYISPSGLSSEPGRYLLKFDPPRELSNSTIDYAELDTKVQVEDGTGLPPVLEIGQITTDWSSSDVNWESPWIRAGGDWNDSTKALATVYSQGDKFLSLDITRILQTWVDGKPNYGLILRCQAKGENTFTMLDSPSLPPGVKARIKVWYTSRETE